MKKVSSLIMVGVSTLSLLTATPSFAKEKGSEEGNRGRQIKHLQIKSNNGLHLGQLKKGKEINEEARASATSTLAFRAAVQQALAAYQAALKTARENLLTAIQQAKAQFLGGNTTTTVNLPPTVSASASPTSTNGTSATVSATGVDDHGEVNLTYSWSVVSPTGVTAPTLSATNGTNAAKNQTVTFHGVGTYVFTVTATDASGLSAAASTTVVVSPVLTAVSVSPNIVSVHATSTQQFNASAADQFGNPFSSLFNWLISEGSTGGSIDGNGLYTAPAASGTFHVVANSTTDATKSASSTVTVTQ